MTRRLTRILPPLLAFAFGAAAMLLFLAPAHADPVIAVTPAGIELSWQAWLLLGAAAAGGVLSVLDVAIAGLKWLAPRTKTTLDDRARDDLQVVRDDIAAVMRVVGGLVPAAGGTAPEKPTAPATPGPVLVKSGTTGMLAILVLGAALGAGAVSTAGCGGSQASRAATISSVDNGLRAAVAALRTYERIHADAIVSEAKSLDDGRAGLAALRTKTGPAWRAVDAAFAAVDVANTVNDDPSIKGAQQALNEAMTAIAALTGGAP